MRKLKKIKEAVTLVQIPAFLSVLLYPEIGNYDSPFITRTTPCERKDGKYYDLRTGKEVKPSGNTLVWTNLSGSVFRYPDGTHLLLAKPVSTIGSNGMWVLAMSDVDFRKESMFIRPVIERKKVADVA